MVSDQEIASCVESLLRQSDPSGVAASVNVNGVVQQLEAKLGLDLSHKAGFIRDQINLLRRPPAPTPREHFAFHHHQQQHYHHLQQQFLHPHQLLQHHQIPASPFTHFPHQHELAFRCTPAVPMQPHHLLQQHQAQPQPQPQPQPPPPPPPPPLAAAAQQQQPAAGVAVAVKQEGQLVSRAAAVPAKGSAATGAKKRGGPGGLSKVCRVSPELQAIVGQPTMSRTEIVRQLWAYIRKNNLQDPNNKRKIICNEELRLVFETDCTDMFKMNKLLAKHIIALEPSKEPGPDKKKLKATEVPSVAETEVNLSAVMISDELAKFFGTGNRQMLQSEALKRVWDHIKMHQLTDPRNPTMIHCDAKLQQLFGCESLSVFGVSEMLASHLSKQS